MAIGSRVSGEVKSASNLYANVNGGWKKAKFGYVKIAGEWKQFWADKLEDAFDRADTTNTLGSSTSGQGWSILRSQWQINNNAAKTTGTKTDYPLASIDLGFLDFNLEANELTPGTGVAIRVEDANNWWGVVPFYNQTAESFSYCVSGQDVSYCIAACSTPYDYTLRCDPPNTFTSEPYYEEVCVGGEVYYEDFQWVNRPDCTTSIQNVCENVSTTRRVCEYVGSRQFCYNETTTKRVCTPTEVENCVDVWSYEDFGGVSCPGGYEVQQVGTTDSCEPNGYTNVPLYACCQAGTYFQCNQTATGTNYTNFYYVQIVKMVAGVFSVVQSFQVPERFSAIKLSSQNTGLTINVYSDSLYTTSVGSFSTTSFTGVGTGYGVLSRPSNFEDGRTIGSIKVTPLGQ